MILIRISCQDQIPNVTSFCLCGIQAARSSHSHDPVLAITSMLQSILQIILQSILQNILQSILRPPSLFSVLTACRVTAPLTPQLNSLDSRNKQTRELNIDITRRLYFHVYPLVHLWIEKYQVSPLLFCWSFPQYSQNLQNKPDKMTDSQFIQWESKSSCR